MCCLFGWRSSCPESSRLDTLECALYVLMRIPQCDGSAVRATGGMLRLAQFCQQPIDLLGVERHVYLDCSVACDRSGDAASAGFGILRLLLAIGDGQHLLQHAFQFAAFEANRRGLDGEGARAKRLRLEAVEVEFVRDGGERDHLRW